MKLRLVWYLALVCLLTPAPAAAQADGWQPGPDASGDNTFQGVIDAPASGSQLAVNQAIQLSGWFVDSTAEGWAGFDKLDVYDGTAGAGTFLATASVGRARPDVSAALGNPYWASAGFALTLQPLALQAGPHTLTVYAHSPSHGWWFKQVSVTVSAAAGAVAGSQPVIAIRAPAENEKLFTRAGVMAVQGYAFDPSATSNQGIGGSGVDRVHVTITDTLQSKLEGDAELGTFEPGAASFGAQFGNTGFRFAFRPSALHAGIAHVDVLAHSVASGKDFETTSTFEIAEGSS